MPGMLFFLWGRLSFSSPKFSFPSCLVSHLSKPLSHPQTRVNTSYVLLCSCIGGPTRATIENPPNNRLLTTTKTGCFRTCFGVNIHKVEGNTIKQTMTESLLIPNNMPMPQLFIHVSFFHFHIKFAAHN